MSWIGRRPRLVFVLALLTATVGLIGSGLPGVASATPTAQTLTGTLPDGATYEIQVPTVWNGTLFLYSHGYVTPGSANPAADVGDPVTGSWLLSHGYALAGSSYASTGWAVQQAIPDQISTLDVFDQQVGLPSRTIAWGDSLGGLISAGLIQQDPSRFDAALPMCGLLSGSVATLNTALDSAFAFQTLLAPSVAVTGITNPSGNLSSAEAAAATAQETPQGRARLALAAALADIPGWFTPLSAEPGPTDYTAQEQNQFEWLSEVDFPFDFSFRAELEARAGGTPSWNTGVDYAQDLNNSADAAEVSSLYQAAGLNLDTDLSTLNSATRISPDPAAVTYLEQNLIFTRSSGKPVLTLDATGDGLSVPENEQAYHQDAQGSQLLRKLFVNRAGHCAFTPAETITAVQTLVNRLATGQWGPHATDPATLNASAAALGPADNIFQSGGSIVPTAPAFIRFKPSAYLRPFGGRHPIFPGQF